MKYRYTNGLLANHRNIPRSTLIKVEMSWEDDGDRVTLKATNGWNGEEISAIPSVTITGEEFNNRPTSHDTLVETFWAFDLLDITAAGDEQ